MTVHSDNNFMVSFVNHDSVLAHITATNPPKNKKIRLFTDTEPVESQSLCVWSVLESLSIFTSHYTTGGIALSVCVFVFHRG